MSPGHLHILLIQFNIHEKPAAQHLVHMAAPDRERILHEYAAITCNRQTIPNKTGGFQKPASRVDNNSDR
jgi:hypothetical protein